MVKHLYSLKQRNNLDPLEVPASLDMIKSRSTLLFISSKLQQECASSITPSRAVKTKVVAKDIHKCFR